MTTDNPTAAGTKPANVTTLDDRRDPRSQLTTLLRRNADVFTQASESLKAARLTRAASACAPPLAPLSGEQQATIDAQHARLRDRDACLETLRAEFAPVAAAVAALAATAAPIEAALRAGELPTHEQLRDASRIANAIHNHTDLEGRSLYEGASEVWQFASLLSGDLVVAADGDVVGADEVDA